MLTSWRNGTCQSQKFLPSWLAPSLISPSWFGWCCSHLLSACWWCLCTGHLESCTAPCLLYEEPVGRFRLLAVDGCGMHCYTCWLYSYIYNYIRTELAPWQWQIYDLKGGKGVHSKVFQEAEFGFCTRSFHTNGHMLIFLPKGTFHCIPSGLATVHSNLSNWCNRPIPSGGSRTY